MIKKLVSHLGEYKAASIKIVYVERLQGINPSLNQLCEHGLGDLIVGIGKNLARICVDNILCYDTAYEEVLRYGDLGNPRSVELANMLASDAFILGDD